MNKKIKVVAANIIKGGKIFATQSGYDECKGSWEFSDGFGVSLKNSGLFGW